MALAAHRARTLCQDPACGHLLPPFPPFGKPETCKTFWMIEAFPPTQPCLEAHDRGSVITAWILPPEVPITSSSLSHLQPFIPRTRYQFAGLLF